MQDELQPMLDAIMKASKNSDKHLETISVAAKAISADTDEFLESAMPQQLDRFVAFRTATCVMRLARGTCELTALGTFATDGVSGTRRSSLSFLHKADAVELEKLHMKPAGLSPG